jgi:hypothetical protein
LPPGSRKKNLQDFFLTIQYFENFLENRSPGIFIAPYHDKTTMKSYLPIAAVILALLNGLLLIPAMSGSLIPLAAIGFVLALAVAALAFREGSRKSVDPLHAPTAVAVPAPIPASPSAPAAARADAEIVAFVALLQEKGRLVDFLMEDLTAYKDEEIGAAARVMHQGCREVLDENFKIAAIADVVEGSEITVPAESAADEYRIVGKLSGTPPFTGTLIHKGWKTDFVKLPRIVKIDGKQLPAIAPAEVELK